MEAFKLFGLLLARMFKLQLFTCFELAVLLQSSCKVIQSVSHNWFSSSYFQQIQRNFMIFFIRDLVAFYLLYSWKFAFAYKHCQFKKLVLK